MYPILRQCAMDQLEPYFRSVPNPKSTARAIKGRAAAHKFGRNLSYPWAVVNVAITCFSVTNGSGE